MTRWNVVDIMPHNLPARKVRQQDTTVLLPADTCRQGEQVNPLRCLQPMKFMKELSDVVVPRRWENQPGSGVHYRLETLELVQRNTGKGCISVI